MSYTYEVTGKTMYYFSHDPREFALEDLVEEIVVTALYDNGDVETYVLEDYSDILVTVSGAYTPADAYDDAKDAYVAKEAALKVADDRTVNWTGTMPMVYIGVKGDADLNGVVDAADASAVLVYAATVAVTSGDVALYSKVGDGLENLAYFLADVDGESTDHGEDGSELDAGDASYILVYAALDGSSSEGVSWAFDVLDSTSLPYYTEILSQYE